MSNVSKAKQNKGIFGGITLPRAWIAEKEHKPVSIQNANDCIESFTKYIYIEMNDSDKIKAEIILHTSSMRWEGGNEKYLSYRIFFSLFNLIVILWMLSFHCHTVHIFLLFFFFFKLELSICPTSGTKIKQNKTRTWNCIIDNIQFPNEIRKYTLRSTDTDCLHTTPKVLGKRSKE